MIKLSMLELDRLWMLAEKIRDIPRERSHDAGKPGSTAPTSLSLPFIRDFSNHVWHTQWSLAVEERKRSTWEMESNLMKSINSLKINSISPFSSTLCCISNEECFDVPSMDFSHTIDINLFRKVSQTEEKKTPEMTSFDEFFQINF